MPDCALTIIIPTLNEADGITAFLEDLRQIAPAAEIILADGGSQDGTPALAATRCDRIVTSAAGRARQMNAGAAAATGHVLLFLHADTRLPADFARQIAMRVRMARSGAGLPCGSTANHAGCRWSRA